MAMDDNPMRDIIEAGMRLLTLEYDAAENFEIENSTEEDSKDGSEFQSLLNSSEEDSFGLVENRKGKSFKDRVKWETMEREELPQEELLQEKTTQETMQAKNQGQEEQPLQEVKTLGDRIYSAFKYGLAFAILFLVVGIGLNRMRAHRNANVAAEPESVTFTQEETTQLPSEVQVGGYAETEVLSRAEIDERMKKFVQDYQTFSIKYYVYFWIDELPIVILRQNYGNSQTRALTYYIDRKTGEVQQFSMLPAFNWQADQNFYLGEEDALAIIIDYAGNGYFCHLTINEEGVLTSERIDAEAGRQMIRNEGFELQPWQYGLF